MDRGGEAIRRQRTRRVDAVVHGGDPMMKRETLELVRAYYKITDARVRRRLFAMTKALASAHEA